MDRTVEKWRGIEARIVALLFALADLAERAAVRPPPVRWLVLWFLWQADAVSRDYISSCPSNAVGGHLPATLRRGNGSDDAMNLAASLRSLARIVRRMAAHLWRLSLSSQAVVSRGHHGEPHHFVQNNPAPSPLDRLDTS